MDEIITLERLESLIKQKDIQQIRKIFDEFNIVDLAEHVSELPVKDSVFIMKVIPSEVSANLFSYLEQSAQTQLIAAFSNVEIKEMLDNLYTDDIVDFLEELPSNLVTKVLKQATIEQRNIVNQILNYDDDSAGSVMTTEYIELKVDDTKQQALLKVNKYGPDAETINYMYVIDAFRKLLGVVSLKELLFAAEDETVSDFMESNIISVKTSDDKESVVNICRKYDLAVIPVLNEHERLTGIITFDDIIDILDEETTEDMYRMAAIEPVDTEYFNTSVFLLAKGRVTWLMILMLSSTITATIMSNAEAQMEQVAMLTVFIPMLMGTGGNSGSQAATVVIRGLATHDIEVQDVLSVLFKESRVALITGLMLATVNSLKMYFIDPHILGVPVPIEVIMVVSGTLMVTVFIAKTVGSMLPLLFKFLKLDPAVMAAPFISTICDAVTLMVYFLLATMLLF